MSYRFSLVTTRHVARRLAACETTAQPHCRSGRKRPCRALALRQALVVPHEASVCRRRCVAALRGSRVLSAGARVGARGGESRANKNVESVDRVFPRRERVRQTIIAVYRPISRRARPPTRPGATRRRAALVSSSAPDEMARDRGIERTEPRCAALRRAAPRCAASRRARQHDRARRDGAAS